MASLSLKGKPPVYKYTVLLVLVVVFVLVFFGLVRALMNDYSIKKEINRLKGEQASLEKKRLESLEFLKTIKTQDFIEKEAREKLGLAKAGEHLVIFASSTENFGEDNFTQKLKRLTNSARWWYYFFAPAGNVSKNTSAAAQGQ